MYFASIVYALAAVVATPTPDDPYTIYQRAREFWAAQRYPDHVAYDIAIHVIESGTPLEERYGARFDADTGTIDIDPVSDYERAHAPTGSGVRIGIPGFSRTAPSSAAVDFIGVPKLAPNYSFGLWPFVPQRDRPPSDADLVRQIRNEFHDPSPRPLPSSSGTQPIATVVARNRVYDIVRVADETIGTCTCIHLVLRPLRDPGAHRLRDLWIDPADYATVRARVGLNFIYGAGTTMPWTIDFVSINGARYIGSERAEGRFTEYRRTFDLVEINFENVRVTSAAAYPHFFSATDILTEP